MSTVVYPGSTLTLSNQSGLTIVSNSTIAVGGLLDGTGTIAGGFALLNLGTIAADTASGLLTITTGTFTNQGTVRASDAPLYVGASVTTPDLTGTTLSGGTWES